MDDIVRNDDGTLVVPVEPERRRDTDEDAPETADVEAAPAAPTTMVLHPGEGGYDQALAEWDAQQHPDRGAAVSTASGREQAATVIHAVAEADGEVTAAVDALEDPEATSEALRHVLVGGVHAVEDFAFEVADVTDSEPLPPHEATKIIGQVLSEIDS